MDNHLHSKLLRFLSLPCHSMLFCHVTWYIAEGCVRLEEERVDKFLHASTKPKLLLRFL